MQKYITKTDEKAEEFDFKEEDFTFTAEKVQGAKVGKKGNAIFVISPKRFKLYTEKTDLVKILSGTGHFKWARGETDFAAGDVFKISPDGEYEVNGAATFIAVRN